MTRPVEFFQDNINRIQKAERDPMTWNLNCGLRALAEQMDRIENNQHDLDRRLSQIEFSLRSR